MYQARQLHADHRNRLSNVWIPAATVAAKDVKEDEGRSSGHSDEYPTTDNILRRRITFKANTSWVSATSESCLSVEVEKTLC